VQSYAVTAIVAMLFGISVGASGMHFIDKRKLVAEQLAHVRNAAQCESRLAEVSATATIAANDALVSQTAMQQRSERLQLALDVLQGEKNASDDKYRAAVGAGDQRVRIAVKTRSAGDLSTGRGRRAEYSQPADGGDGARTYADLHPAVAERVFRVAADDQREIDKLARLQAWACVVKPDAPACTSPQ